MAITVHQTDDGMTAVVGFSGSLTFADWPEFKNKCLLDRVYSPKLLVDFRNLNEINMAGLSMVLLLHKRLPKDTGQVTLLACNERIRDFLNCVECERWFSIPKGCERGHNATCRQQCCEPLVKGVQGKTPPVINLRDMELK
jgi:anti-anti-sigma regulatory factor